MPTIGSMLQFFPFHQSYHAGQIAVLRQAQGLASMPAPRPS
jgi:uncharacterized damage-inducible protein DinB